MKQCKNYNLIRNTFLYDEAARRYKEISERRLEVERELQKAPPGIIHVSKSGPRIQFYLRANKSDRVGKYLRKSDAQTIQIFLQKYYLEKVLKLLKIEEKNLELLLKGSVIVTEKISAVEKINVAEKIKRLYSDFPAQIKCYIDPVDMSYEDFASNWQSAPYVGKEIPDYVPVYETMNGERVRSKSELTIANMLAEKGIPYKYECPKRLLNGKVFYPDFTVLNVTARKEVYWEHRGMMDDREYARQAVFKMKSLMKNGIFIGDNLIITEETSANPLGTDEIESIIGRYFCETDDVKIGEI